MAASQLRQAGRGGVAVELGLAGRVDGCLDNVVRGGEVRLAGAKANDRTPGSLQGLGFGINGKGGGFGNGGDPCGYAAPGGDGQLSSSADIRNFLRWDEPKNKHRQPPTLAHRPPGSTSAPKNA